MRIVACLCAFAASCAPESAPLQDAFFNAVTAHCGKAFAGRLISEDEVDRDFASEVLVMEVRSCSGEEIRIPFHIGDDRSRTWVLTKTDDGLRLKHDHRRLDGSPDAVTMYGGDTVGEGTAMRQEFPVDQFSAEMFTREGLSASVTNVWAVEITAAAFAYELRRENRYFRVEFDLAKPIANPPPPWGSL